MQDAQTFAGLFHVAVLYLALAILLGMVAITSIAWLVKTVAVPMRRLLGGGMVRIVLVTVMVGTGIVESFSKHTNGLPRSVPTPLTTVTLEDVSNGWRVAATREGRTLSRPQDGAYAIHDPWLARGGFGDVARIAPTGWSFPWRDGFADGLRVLSDGEVRLDLRTSYFPRPLEGALAVAPAFNWHLLPGGISNVFWHAATPSNSLIVAWENAPVNCDASCLTNFQAEFFADGRFAYRHPDQEVEYAPVFPFDWDNDGLENSVDPDPIVAGPDAHGTNVEWYNTVCSNVLEASVELSWCEGVNSNAYYFVDVVAERGPAPIWFLGDRTSRLGDPVVVARAGETNRVPLLIGIDYAITSPVPFTVSYPMEYMYPELETNELCRAHIRWPLGFSVMPDGNGYRVVAAPYDPGCEFQWPMPTRSVTCGYTTSGGWIGFDCGSGGNCGCGGCSVTGTATLEDAEFGIPSVWCGCWHDDSGEPSGSGTPQTNEPSVSVSFDKAVVFYEDAYTNAPRDVVAKRSTKTTLSVSASAGENGGMLYVTAGNIGKLVRTGGNAITFPYAAYVPAHGGASFAIEYEAAEHSDSANDISVTASLQSASDSASATAVQLEFTPDYLIDGCLHRHRLGVRESAKCSWMPATVAVTCEAGTGGYVNEGIGTWAYTAPLTAGDYPYLSACCGDFSHTFSLDIIEPQAIVVRSTNAFDYGVPPNVAGGAGMELELVVSPTNVSFMGIAVQEVPSDYHDPQGYFANSYFDVVWSHTTNRGAGVWHRIQADNVFMYDYAEMGDQLPRMTPTGEITDDCTYGWIAGFMNWMIPVGWNETASDEAASPVRQICVYWQRFRMASDGTLEVEKLGNVVQRGTNSVIRLNGELVPLRPR